MTINNYFVKKNNNIENLLIKIINKLKCKKEKYVNIQNVSGNEYTNKINEYANKIKEYENKLELITNNINAFNEQCQNYIDENHNNELQEKLKFNNNIIKTRLENISNISDEYIYLFNKYLLNNLETKLLIHINNKKNKWKCSLINNNFKTTNYIGGSNIQHFDNKYIKNKIIKYSKKYSISKKDIYKNKIQKYLNLIGGNNSINLFNNNIDNIINNKFDDITKIINKEYSHLTDAFKKINYTNKMQNIYAPLTETLCLVDKEKNKMIQKNSSCEYMLDENSKLEEINYLFNKIFKGESTDSFMQDVLDQKYYVMLSNYILIELQTTLSEYIYKYNIINSTKQLDIYKDIKLLYKGGNTVRLHINLFFNTIRQLIPDIKFIEGSMFDIKLLKLGDWDFNIFINYKELGNKGFNNDELNQLYNNIKQIVAICLFKIKNNFRDLLNSELSYNFTNKILDKLKKQNYNDYIEEYNKTNLDTSIQKMTFTKLKTFNYIYDANKLKLDFDNKPIEKYSFQRIANSREYGINNVSINNLYTMFSNNNMTEFLPDFLIPNNIYIALLDELKFHKARGISNFLLYRMKFNNIAYVNKLIKNNTTEEEMNEEQQYNLGIEMIDVSISTINDTKFSSQSFTMKKESPRYTNLENYKIYDEQVINIDIPSFYYMFYDLSDMLFVENIFPFESKKYEKRIRRILLLSLICIYNDGENTDDIIKYFTHFKNIINKNKDLLVNDKYYNMPHDNINILPMHKHNNQEYSQFNILKLNNDIIYFYIDIFLENYYHCILIIKYLLNDPIEQKYIDLCDSVFLKSKKLEEGINFSPTSIIPFSEYQKADRINNYIEELSKYEIYLIKSIDEILNFLEEVKKKGIDNIISDYSNLSQLF